MENKRPVEYTLKLTGKASIPAPLDIGHNYTVKINGSIVSKTEADSQGEEILMYYKFVPVLVEVITPRGETLKSKDTRSMGQQMRALLYKKWREEVGSNETSEEFYQRRMIELMGEIY